MVRELTSGQNKGLFGLDFWMLAAINRSLSSIDAFGQLTRKCNYLAAFSIVRLHLDTLLRLYATTLATDANGLVERLMGGNELRKEKDRDGKLMTDSYLVERLQQDLQLTWVTSVYKKTSGFIHLSHTHIYAPMWIINEEGRSVEVLVSEKARRRPEIEIEAIDCMQDISKLLLELIREWSRQKPKSIHHDGMAK